MKNFRRRFSTQEKLEILQEADQFGTTHIQIKYELSPSIISRWEKDLKNSRTRQASINKQNDTQVIESLKAQIEQLKKMIANQTPLTQNTEQKSQVSEPTMNGKEDELYRLVASLIVQTLLNDNDEESGINNMVDGE